MRNALFAALLVLLPVSAGAQTAAEGADDQAARAFAVQFWSKWSSPNAVALPYILSVVSDPISFYGKSMSRDEYVKAQTTFTKRWPDRRYIVQAGSENISCDRTSLRCDVSGTVSWRDRSPDRNATSTGSAKFNFLLRGIETNGAVTYLLAGETGTVLQRNVDQATPQPAMVPVPYVGCTGDIGGVDISAPPGHPINLAIPPAIAAKLAFYYGLNMFVLAPRGWTCDASQGADAQSLVVAPPNSYGFNRPAVILENTSSDDNGDFLVTAYGGAYFPKLFTSQDVDSVIDELKSRGENPTRAQFLASKYPDDRVTYVDSSVLEYRTPPGEMGLGMVIGGGLPGPGFYENPDPSKSLSKLPTDGVIGLVKLPDYPDFYVINLLTIRLPMELAALSPAIQGFTAHCQPFDQQAACADQIDFENSSP